MTLAHDSRQLGTGMHEEHSDDRAIDHSGQEETKEEGDREQSCSLVSGDGTPSGLISLRRCLHQALTSQSSVLSASTLSKISPSGQLRRIGAGSCGTVFKIPETHKCIKIAPVHQDPVNERLLAVRAHKEFSYVRELMEDLFKIMLPRVPMPHELASPAEALWESFPQTRFPESYKLPRRPSALVSTRIFPLSKTVREALVRLFFPPDIHAKTLADETSKNCLIRLYLGANAPENATRHRDSLENFPLYHDMATEILLLVDEYAKSMAVALAVLHWAARCSGEDSEWVLGRAPVEDEAALPVNCKRPGACLWLLDFDKAKSLDFDDHDDEFCLLRMLAGVTNNDPYLPNPKSSSRDLWELFRQTYKDASERVMANYKHTLPSRFFGQGVDMPEAFLQKWGKWAGDDEELEIVFE